MVVLHPTNWKFLVPPHNRHSSHNLPQAYRGRNLYARFGLGPQTIYHNTQWQVSGPINSGTVNAKTKFNNQKSKYWVMNFKDILDLSKQYIYVNKYKHPTVTLATTFLKPSGKKIRMSCLDMFQRKLLSDLEKVSGPIKNYFINVNKKVNNKLCFYQN